MPPARAAEDPQPEMAERAYTAIVEMQPNESESHTMLAEIRQEQDRWNDAINHWRRVADLRALEPTGLISLAKAQLHEKQWDAAGETIRKLRQRSWPSRFDRADTEIRNLEYALERKEE